MAPADRRGDGSSLSVLVGVGGLLGTAYQHRRMNSQGITPGRRSAAQMLAWFLEFFVEGIRILGQKAAGQTVEKRGRSHCIGEAFIRIRQNPTEFQLFGGVVS